MKFAVVVFPGSNCDHDAYYAVDQVLREEAAFVWHKETSLGGADAVILPGGFAHGDYLRTGAIARFSPIMADVRRFADAGGPVLGICNGFQVLLEAGLLPGAMLRNDSLHFRCEHVHVRVEHTDTPFTEACRQGQVLRIPIAHGEGNYYAEPDVVARARTEPPGAVPLRRRRGPGDRRRQPERIGGQHRRPVQRGAQRGGPDAASRACVRTGRGQRRRAGDAAVGGPLVRAAVAGRGGRARRVESVRMTPDVSSDAVLERHGLTREEFEKIVGMLGRQPTLTELGIFSVMWSEHCSYKSSRVHLKTLPTTGPRVLQGPGENAGAVDIGDGLAAVFKIESHNHPSFIEPYQGAATGVGGIIRDIFTMGARPIALLNSLRFGQLDNPLVRRNMAGVVAGIAGYGNSIGIPTVGGEIAFDESYTGNPLVNVFCLGISRADEIIKGVASGVGNAVFYVGSKTGRDGIHGATMASAEFDEKSAEKRPAVQVGDPFMEKLLLEACLEVMKTDALVGIQDMGAAGLTCSTCEMGARGGAGVEIDVSLVPQRETGMTPYEIMLSESQERMLLVAKQGREAEVQAIFEKWDLHAVHIGTVTPDGLLRVKERGTVVAEIPNTALTDEAPLYRRPYSEPAYLREAQQLSLAALGTPAPAAEVLRRLLASPTVASKRWVYRQYDHMVRTNTLVMPGMGAGVVRIKDTTRALALSVDCNGRFVYLDPFVGAQLAVAEAARNVACAGALPIGATNCLNFGNPQKPDIMWQFVRAVEGMGAACRALDIPITGGNVSLYNETDGRGVLPTPVLGVVGLIEDASRVVRRPFQTDRRRCHPARQQRERAGRQRVPEDDARAHSRRAAGARSRSARPRCSACSWPAPRRDCSSRRTTAPRAAWR